MRDNNLIRPRRHLGWVTARRGGDLVGFANVAWDGAGHARLVDVMVASGAKRQGVGEAVVAEATCRAAEAGCEWLHVDFERQLRAFYLEACGFTPIDAGVIRLRR